MSPTACNYKLNCCWRELPRLAYQLTLAYIVHVSSQLGKVKDAYVGVSSREVHVADVAAFTPHVYFTTCFEYGDPLTENLECQVALGKVALGKQSNRECSCPRKRSFKVALADRIDPCLRGVGKPRLNLAIKLLIYLLLFYVQKDE
jgi:hypothetical protein